MADTNVRGVRFRRLKAFCKYVLPSVGVLLMIFGLFVYQKYAEFKEQMPSLDGLDKQLDLETRIIDRNNIFIGGLGNQRRTIIEYKDLPPLFVKAVIATEDQRFWEHGGVDFRGVARAFLAGVKNGFHFRQGASTITQQVVKNYLGCAQKERGAACKVVEMLVAWEIESKYTKEQILTMYFNKIGYGGQYYGIDAGARRFFGAPVGQLDLARWAMLAGLPQSPEKKSPFKNPKAAKERQEHVLACMRRHGDITSSDYDKAKAEEMVYVSERAPEAHTGQEVLDYVRDFLTERYGTMERISQLGLTAQVTIDIKLQAEVEKALTAGVINVGHGRKYAPQGAAVLIDSATGEILAMKGGAPYKAGGLNRVLQSPRQPGSIMKLFLYTAAIANSKITPNTVFGDQRDCYNDHGRKWCPDNYSGEKAETGSLAARPAFAHSFNTVAIKIMCGAERFETRSIEPSDDKVAVEDLPKVAVCKERGLVDETLETAHALGVKSELEATPSLALGTSTVKVIEVAGAYAAIANGGQYVEPFLIKQITGKNAPALPERATRQAISSGTAATMKSLLRSVAVEGTAKSAEGRLSEDVHGKTGTTSDFSDAWFAGFAGHITGVVQVGYDRAYCKTCTKLGKGQTGASAALPIWTEIMSWALDGKPAGTVQRMSRRVVDDTIYTPAEEAEPAAEPDVPGTPAAEAPVPVTDIKRSIEINTDDLEGSGTDVTTPGGALEKAAPSTPTPRTIEINIDDLEGSGTEVP